MRLVIFLLRFRRIDTERDRIHIHQHRNRLEINNDLCSRCERGGRHKHFIAWLQSDCFQRDVQGCGARTYPDGVPGPHIGCKVLLEFEGLRPHREPTGTNDVSGRLGFVFSDAGDVKWNCLLFDFHRWIAIHGERGETLPIAKDRGLGGMVRTGAGCGLDCDCVFYHGVPTPLRRSPSSNSKQTMLAASSQRAMASFRVAAE